MDDEIYVGSVSPTVSSVEVRTLKELAHKIGPSLTMGEYIKIMDIFGRAIDRIMKENNINQ